MRSPNRLRSAFIIVAALTAPAPSFAQSPCATVATMMSCGQWARIDASMAQLIHQGYSLVGVRPAVFPPSQDMTTTFYLFRPGDLVRCTEIFSATLAGEAAFGCERLVEPYRVR
jgi:hypothetical protein